MRRIESEFRGAHECLLSLFGEKQVNTDKLHRLYEECEEVWKINLGRLKGGPVKYLLIGEAPPSVEGRSKANYFYSGLKGPWCSSILSTFKIERSDKDVETPLTKLGRKGFLLVDTLPFAMKYTSQLRLRYHYYKMVGLCKEWVEKKLAGSGLAFAPDLKIAFAFKLNAQAVIEMYDGCLQLPGRKECLCQDMIAASGSGFTSAALLRKAFCR